MDTFPQLYSLSTECQKLFIRKRGWEEPRRVHLETVEISPWLFCFEWENDEFQDGDDLHLNLYLPDRLMEVAATVLSVEESRLLEGGYDLQTQFIYCAQFQVEIDGEYFRKIKGTPRKCKSLSGP